MGGSRQRGLGEAPAGRWGLGPGERAGESWARLEGAGARRAEAGARGERGGLGRRSESGLGFGEGVGMEEGVWSRGSDPVLGSPPQPRTTLPPETLPRRPARRPLDLPTSDPRTPARLEPPRRSAPTASTPAPGRAALTAHGPVPARLRLRLRLCRCAPGSALAACSARRGVGEGGAHPAWGRQAPAAPPADPAALRARGLELGPPRAGRSSSAPEAAMRCGRARETGAKGVRRER